MDDLQAIRKSFTRHIWLNLFIENIVFGTSLYLSIKYLNFKLYVDFAMSGVVAVAFITVIAVFLSKFITQPLNVLRQAILHLSPSGVEPAKAPDINKLAIGQELITNLTGQLYEIARIGHEGALKDGTLNALNHDFIANALPLPLFVLDENEQIKFVNKAAADYIGMATGDIIGKNVYSVLDMSFTSEDTYDSWLASVKQKAATATRSWERVCLRVHDNHPTLLFDLAAYYNKSNVSGYSTLLVMFDHTKQYSQDDQSISFVALSVHELRTPLTLLRGYIEVFEDELQGKVSPELEGFLDKLRASSDQLTAFVNNILNVARVDNDQLELKLMPEDWAEVLTKSVDINRLRARINGIDLQLTIDPGLPKVGVDRLSIQEVVNNLIDNAIKYSGSSKVIKIHAGVNGEKLVETTVEDYGVGIPASVMPNLFTKFYRDHRNRAQIGGTGLGLYLSNAIVKAHSGNLWVRSTEGQGSTFGFTLIPYDQLSKDQKAQENQEVVRSAHGWIKNHSYYRR